MRFNTCPLCGTDFRGGAAAALPTTTGRAFHRDAETEMLFRWARCICPEGAKASQPEGYVRVAVAHGTYYFEACLVHCGRSRSILVEYLHHAREPSPGILPLRGEFGGTEFRFECILATGETRGAKLPGKPRTELPGPIQFFVSELDRLRATAEGRRHLYLPTELAPTVWSLV